ncbi:hypothetical protein DFO73_101520 [Cytobacillus oceanisediminis]|uniref:DNA-binding protein (MmcQ/YjbR family) n=1 Tax=Cytobacillus oceanisediminis TaxID=665099 RepID=A0A2V3A580_9BACI|nr:MmcQ/YjbR family DNA-binding protein [Cytobacillus oceanisediminis]PWW32257.1 hypothetical protein DFO73_101520 [Cytobacillus oceanisediminis]
MKTQDTESIRANLCKICLALPEAVEYIDEFGHNTFKINGKLIVISGESDKGFSLSLKSDRETQGLLLKKEHFFKPLYIGQHGWVSILNPDGEDWDELIVLIQEAYLCTAPKRLVKNWMEMHNK